MLTQSYVDIIDVFGFNLTEIALIPSILIFYCIFLLYAFHCALIAF